MSLLTSVLLGNIAFWPTTEALLKTYYAFITKWGFEGTGSGEFIEPRAVAVDSSTHEVYVADRENHRIQKFKLSGDGTVTLITSWGNKGSGNKQFNIPDGVAVDSATHNVYVADTGNDRVQEFTNNGVFIRAWSNNGQFDSPHGIAVDSSTHEVYVTSSSSQIQKFITANGCPVGTQKAEPGVCFVTKWGTEGSGSGQFRNLEDIDIDSSTHHVYTVEALNQDSANHRVQKFTSTGIFVTKWGSFGSDDGQFRFPRGIGVDSSSHEVLVADTTNSRIQKFSDIGTFFKKWGSLGSGNGQFSAPSDVAVDPSTHLVYVTESGNDRVQVFSLKVLKPQNTVPIPH